MDKRLIAVAVGVLVVVAAVVAFFSLNSNSERVSSDYTGTWYQIYEELGTAEETDKPHFEIHEYVITQNMKPFVIDKIEMNMFTGSFDGLPIIGSILNDYMTFEIGDEESNTYGYYEGLIEGDTITMNIMDMDGGFSKVLSGTYAVYVREGSDYIPDLDPIYNVEDFWCSDGIGFSYETDEEDIIVESEFTPLSFEFIEQNRFVSVVKLTSADSDNPDSVIVDYFVCLFNSIDNGVLSYIMCGCRDDCVYSGEVSIADEILYVYLDDYNVSETSLGFTILSFTTNYDRGELDYPESIFGTWTGQLYYTFGDGIIKEEYAREKFIVDTSDCFASIESYPGDDDDYIWIGYIKGNFVTITAQHGDVYYPLFGYTILNESEDEVISIHLGGYIGDGEDGSYRAVYLELYPEHST